MGFARPVEVAVVLAAGLGSRLSAHWDEQPKGLFPVDGETLVGRSVRLLRDVGVERVVLVAGHLAPAYHAFARECSGVEVVENPDYATTGSMASLAVALPRLEGDFLLLESDLFYEPRALSAVLDHGADDVLLASGPTGAGDEVYVSAVDGRLRGLSKQRDELDAVVGELVGILRVGHDLARDLGERFRAFVARNGHGRMAYETDALVAAAAHRPVAVCLVDDLLWGELDDERHLRRLREELLPAWRRREAAG